MGYVLTDGVVATEICRFTYFGTMIDYGSNTERTVAFVPLEAMVPWDLHSLYQTFLNSGNTSWNYYIAKYSGGLSYGIRFQQRNNVVRIKVVDSYTSSGWDEGYTLYEFEYGSNPSDLRVLVLYDEEGTYVDADPTLQFYIVTPNGYWANIYVEMLPANRGGVDGIWGAQVAPLVDISGATPRAGVHVDNINALIKDPNKFADFIPEQPSGIPYASYWRNMGFRPKVSQLRKGSGAEPDPYVPPTPPTPPTPSDDPNEQDEDYPSSQSTPEGDYERDYDPVPIPNKPSDGVADAGFITLYRMTFREFDEFASKCFADTIWGAIKLKFNNPTDFLVGALLLPFIPNVGLSFYPKFGAETLDTAYPRIDNQFHDVDCGSVTINKYWGNCFDYEPYTKIQIWLPYIGYKDLPVDEFMGQTISVKYRCDCLTGDCIAFVYTGTVGQSGPQVERVIAQFYGNCGVRVPFGSQSYDAAVAAGITLIGAAAASGLVAAGSAAIGAESGAGVLMAAGQGASAVAAGTVGRSASVGVVQGMKPNVQHGGAAGASSGYMSVQVPYLIRRIPRQSLPEGYMNLKGYPSNIGGKLADFTGLAIVDDIQLNNIPAMEDERKEIIDWLRGGVLI